MPLYHDTVTICDVELSVGYKREPGEPAEVVCIHIDNTDVTELVRQCEWAMLQIDEHLSRTAWDDEQAAKASVMEMRRAA